MYPGSHLIGTAGAISGLWASFMIEAGEYLEKSGFGGGGDPEAFERMFWTRWLISRFLIPAGEENIWQSNREIRD